MAASHSLTAELNGTHMRRNRTVIASNTLTLDGHTR